MADLTCSDYSEKAVVVRGDTKTHKEGLKNLGGKFNASLKDGAGWIFPKKLEGKIKDYIEGSQTPKVESKMSKPVESKDFQKDGMKFIKDGVKNMSVADKIAFVNCVVAAVFGEQSESLRSAPPTVAPRYPKPISKLVDRVSSEESESGPKKKKSPERIVVLPKSKISERVSSDESGPKKKSRDDDSDESDDNMVLSSKLKPKPKPKPVVSDTDEEDDEVVVPRKRLLKGY